MHRRRPIAFYIPDFRAGGTEKVVVLIANACSALGEDVDLVVSSELGDFRSQVDRSVRIENLNGMSLYSPVLGLAGYLRRRRPRALFSALNGANLMSVIAKSISGVDTRIIFSMHNHIGEKHARNPATSHVLREMVLCKAYGLSDAVVAVSEPIRRYLIREWKLPVQKVVCIDNPVDPKAVECARSTRVDHPFLKLNVPVVVSVGRLHEQKDFCLLLEAFSQFSSCLDSRLLIIGEGPERNRLEKLIVDLGLGDRVCLLGFVEKPLAWLVRCDLFVMSSKWEGSPLVLIEAMSLGLPIVSTDCVSGPRELLADYPLGRLVPVSDVKALALAMREATSLRKEESLGEKLVEERSSEKVAKLYLELVD